MRRARGVGAAVLAVAFGLALAPGPAQAELVGDCEATGTFLNGIDGVPFTVDAATIGDEVVTVPRSDTVEWFGSVNVPAAPRPNSGEVYIDLPWPFGTTKVDEWSGDGSSVENSGIEEYDLGWYVPAGVEFQVLGAHYENGALFCAGYANVKIDGGAFSGPMIYVSLGLTAVSGVAFVALIRPVFRRVV